MNTYNIDNETCTECDKEGELVYNQYTNTIHCQACNTYFNVNGEVLEGEQNA